jgi:RNA polymerase sigma factor (sigma-70 family)
MSLQQGRAGIEIEVRTQADFAGPRNSLCAGNGEGQNGKYGVMTMTSDAALIGRSLARGDEFEVIFDRHAARVLRYLRLRVGDDLAGELTAETFAQAFHHRQRYDPARGSAIPWLYGIASNPLRMHWRTEQRRLRAYAQAAVRQPDNVSMDRIEVGSLAPGLSEGLLALSRGEREVLLLHAWAELSQEEIADVLAISPGAVRKRLHRARAALAQRLAGASESTTTSSREDAAK